MNLEKSAKILSLPMTCTRITRLHLLPFKSDNSQLNSPFDLLSAVFTLEINRETPCGVELSLNRCRKLELTAPACPFDEMPTTPTHYIVKQLKVNLATDCSSNSIQQKILRKPVTLQMDSILF